MGKTALAITVAAACSRDFPGGVTVVWLGSLRSEELVAAELAAQLGLPRTGGQSSEDALTGWSAERDVLLVIDNCEHVVSAVAALVEALTTRLPRLRVPPGARTQVDRVRRSPGARTQVDRVQAEKPGRRGSRCLATISGSNGKTPELRTFRHEERRMAT